jgi:hypothetical protein
MAFSGQAHFSVSLRDATAFVMSSGMSFALCSPQRDLPLLSRVRFEWVSNSRFAVTSHRRSASSPELSQLVYTPMEDDGELVPAILKGF